MFQALTTFANSSLMREPLRWIQTKFRFHGLSQCTFICVGGNEDLSITQLVDTESLDDVFVEDDLPQQGLQSWFHWRCHCLFFVRERDMY